MGSRRAANINPTATVAKALLLEFRSGVDTYDLAKSIGISEATVCKLLDIGRQIERSGARSGGADV